MKYISLLLLTLLLTGCPGKGTEGAESGERQSIYIDGSRVCFTINKTDTLSRYILSGDGETYMELLKGDFLALSYPDTCFNVSLIKGTVYGASYTLNSKNYYYTFIIDNSGNILDLGRK